MGTQKCGAPLSSDSLWSKRGHVHGLVRWLTQLCSVTLHAVVRTSFRPWCSESGRWRCYIHRRRCSCRRWKRGSRWWVSHDRNFRSNWRCLHIFWRSQLAERGIQWHWYGIALVRGVSNWFEISVRRQRVGSAWAAQVCPFSLLQSLADPPEAVYGVWGTL